MVDRIAEFGRLFGVEDGLGRHRAGCGASGLVAASFERRVNPMRVPTPQQDE